MPSLASMRQLDPGGDSFQPLGPPIRETPVDPTPLPKPTGTPGVVQMPDGKLATNLPDPTVKPATKLDLSGTVTGRTPQVGDWVRILSGQDDVQSIACMVGYRFQITGVRPNYIEVGRFVFWPPGKKSHDGQLETEFAELPL